MTPRFARLEEILPLRDAVIIAGTDRDTPFFPGDRDAATRHIGVFVNGRCVGCATFLVQPCQSAPAWQLRGMATAPDCRGQGLGRAMLAFAEAELPKASGARVLWCNARESAAGFYRKLGWETVSELFDVPGVGPHYRMLRRLPQDRKTTS
ncbi:MAG: GNAT family N-acetyltransferase [Candidatus Hydrogenedentes bacterium]|nr:GNAT family N-acetyltransferase [Candidatus Hydrogenedentota bacterium]